MTLKKAAIIFKLVVVGVSVVGFIVAILYKFHEPTRDRIDSKKSRLFGKKQCEFEEE